MSVGYLDSNRFLFAPRIHRGQLAEKFVKAFGHPHRSELLQRQAARFVTHLSEALRRAQQISKFSGKGGGFAQVKDGSVYSFDNLIYRTEGV